MPTGKSKGRNESKRLIEGKLEREREREREKRERERREREREN